MAHISGVELQTQVEPSELFLCPPALPAAFPGPPSGCTFLKLGWEDGLWREGALLGAQGAQAGLQRQAGVSRAERLWEGVPGVPSTCSLACHLIFLSSS